MTLVGRHQDPASARGSSRVIATDEPRNEPKPRLPNFLVIGAMKAGTTSLYHYLRAHPEVFMPAIKELDFFAEEGNWRRGFGWYAKQFREADPKAVAVGEASTVYTKHPNYRGVPERIAAHLPDVRLIYVVRDPIERIRSHYQHRVAVGAEKNPVDRAVLENPTYLNFSRYAFQIEQYLPHVPRERILVITSESLRRDRRDTIRRVYDFVGVATGFVPPTLDREYYRTEGRPVYPPAVWSLRRTAKRWIPGAKRAKEFVDSIGVRRRRRASPDAKTGRSDRLPIPDHVRRTLERELRDDVRRLREYLPTGFDGWGLT
jgi:hypothetical protein